jgi:hypothetical protein
MFKWFFGKQESAPQTIGQFNISETKQLLVIANDFDQDLRRRMARDLMLTKLLIEEARPEAAKAQHLEELLRFWNASRNEVLDRGANSESDVEWNNAACNESWLMMEVGFRKGAVSKSECDDFTALVTQFIDKNLPAVEKQEVQTLFSSQRRS